jgi:uncharacterized protein YbjT (DUF2867 family)
MEETVLVIGASGRLGHPIAFALRENGFHVRVMGRNGERLHRLFDENFEIWIGDAADQSAVSQATEGCAGVHISVTHGPEEPNIVKNVLQAAKAHEVTRISYVSGTSVREENAWFPIVTQKLYAENLIRESALKYTIFKPTWFMEMIPNFVKERMAVCFGKGDTKLHFLAVSDFAAMVAKAFATDETQDQSYRILGPEAISLYDAIDRCRAVLHPHIRKVTTLPFWVAKLAATFRRSDEMKFAVDLVRYFEQVQEGEMPQEVVTILGKPQTTLDQWLKLKKVQNSHRGGEVV